jgi:hypothetical protein
VAVVRVTVVSSTFATVTPSIRKLGLPLTWATRFSEKTTSSAVIGVPSEKTTSSRSPMVWVRPSAETSSPVAMSGIGVVESVPSKVNSVS